MIRSKLLSTSSPSVPPPPSSNPPNPLRRSATPTLRLKFSSPPLLAGARRSSCGRLRLSGPSGDGKAESVRAERFKFRDGRGGGGGGGGEEEDEWGSWRSEKRRWWSEEDSAKEVDEDFEAFDDVPLEQDPWDAIWIFKVFKSYGYLLPVIIASMLLTTGPKAFLMALALPLGQSAISLVIDKVWGKMRAPQTKPKFRKQKSTSSNWGHKRRWQDQSGYDDDRGRNGYQSWATDASVGDKAESSGPGLGGWDELDWQAGKTNGFRQQPPPPPFTPNTSPQSNLSKKGKLSRGGKYKDVPLFLRLLIAAFPFLASWTRIFW